MQNWNEFTQVKKGNIGEAIIQNILEEKGYIVYKALTFGRHAFDFLAVKDKSRFVIAEVKSKARLNILPVTGINLTHYNEYIHTLEKTNIDIILFFLDEHPKEQRIYCQLLRNLMQPKIIDNNQYPNFNISKGKVLFHLSEMRHVRNLTVNELESLKAFSTRKYEYA